MTELPDGTFEAHRRGASASVPSVTAPTFRALELECLAARVTWTLTPAWRAR
ncbi:hypothetical protein [Streptosporangium sp. NPDC006007]|uniref:hypothetical protein n=1 Tax=Streptosporangium sp. NPDC006007 TaxID=3154575 RepID=UPI0033BCD7AC